MNIDPPKIKLIKRIDSYPFLYIHYEIDCLDINNSMNNHYTVSLYPVKITLDKSTMPYLLISIGIFKLAVEVTFKWK